jgi:hypothetical protein
MALAITTGYGCATATITGAGTTVDMSGVIVMVSFSTAVDYMTATVALATGSQSANWPIFLEFAGPIVGMGNPLSVQLYPTNVSLTGSSATWQLIVQPTNAQILPNTSLSINYFIPNCT